MRPLPHMPPTTHPLPRMPLTTHRPPPATHAPLPCMLPLPCTPPCHTRPPPQQDAVNEWAVRILLECILIVLVANTYRGNFN